MFGRQAKGIWSEDELTALVDHLAFNPEAGVVIPGTGGVRKLRWGRAGSGKRGGARVVYFYFHTDHPLYLMFAYAKSQAEDMSADDKKRIAILVDAIRQEAKGTVQ